MMNQKTVKTYKHYNIEQRICAEPIRTMDTHTCCFTSGIQPFHNMIFSIFDVQDLAVVIRWYAAHAIMYSRQHRDRFFCDVNSCKDRSSLSDTR